MKYLSYFQIGAVLGMFATSTVFAAETTISDTDKYAWGANIGWINFRPDASSDSPTTNADGGDGATVRSSYIQGRVWSANTGWITLGDLDGPVNGHAYANNSATDYGVNIQNSNQLRGYAYGANIGWINFGNNYPGGTADAEFPQIDLSTGELSGYAWGANVGWINLGDGSFSVTTDFIERPDDDTDGIDDTWEYQVANGLAPLGPAPEDSDGDGASDVDEFAANTNPFDLNDRLEITQYVMSGDNLTADITYTSDPQRLYQLSYKDDLGAATWTDLGGPALGNPGTTTANGVATGFGSAPQMRFYKVEAFLPLPAAP